MRSVLKVAAATGAFAMIHSALASRAAKRAAASVFGERARNAFYRPAYIAQSVATSTALAALVLREPGRELYRIRGPLALAMRAGQAASLGYLAWAANQVGVGRLVHTKGPAAWRRGETSIPAEPEAQGPAPPPGAVHAGLEATGPFRHARHPLNLAAVPMLWLNPRMTTSLLTFNLLATAYLVAGSIHEEARLRAEYGEEYERYRASGVPFFLPGGGARPAIDHASR